MSPPLGLLDQVGAASVVAGCITVVLTWLSLDGPHWERKVAASAEEHENRLELTREFYRKRPLKLYEFVPHLALRKPFERRKDRFRLRASKAAGLPTPLLDKAEQAAREWIATVGALAQEAYWMRVDLRPFLGTYHLGVIREGVIAVPIAMSMMAQGKLEDDDRERLGYGLALVELAVSYNSRARQQRQAIYFAATDHTPPIGPVLRAPKRWKCVAYNFLEHFERPLRVTRWGRRRWGRWLVDVASRMPRP